MRVAKLYDKISSHYSDFDFCDVHAKCSGTLLECIEETELFKASYFQDASLTHAKQNLRLVDLGAGDGRFLEAVYKKYPNVKLTGLDISSKMLALAQQKVNFQAINVGIQQAGTYLPENTFDLATANFVCAYVGLEKVLEQVRTSLKPNGYICIATSTFESFTATQQQVHRLAKSFNPFKRFVGVTLQHSIKGALVPIDYNHIVETAKKMGFSLHKRKQLITELNFDNGEAFLEIALRGGWIVTLFEQVPIPSAIVYSIAKFLVHTFQFPFKDKCIVEVVMLQKT